MHFTCLYRLHRLSFYYNFFESMQAKQMSYSNYINVIECIQNLGKCDTQRLLKLALYIKVGCKGVYIIRRCLHDEVSLYFWQLQVFVWGYDIFKLFTLRSPTPVLSVTFWCPIDIFCSVID